MSHLHPEFVDAFCILREVVHGVRYQHSGGHSGSEHKSEAFIDYILVLVFEEFIREQQSEEITGLLGASTRCHLFASLCNHLHDECPEGQRVRKGVSLRLPDEALVEQVTDLPVQTEHTKHLRVEDRFQELTRVQLLSSIIRDMSKLAQFLARLAEDTLQNAFGDKIRNLCGQIDGPPRHQLPPLNSLVSYLNNSFHHGHKLILIERSGQVFPLLGPDRVALIEEDGVAGHGPDHSLELRGLFHVLVLVEVQLLHHLRVCDDQQAPRSREFHEDRRQHGFS